MSKSNWDKGFTAGAKAGRKGETNSVCTICCDGCKEHGERVERDRIIELLRKEAKHLKQVSESIAMDEYMDEEDSQSMWWASVELNKFADALIKGEK